MVSSTLQFGIRTQQAALPPLNMARFLRDPSFHGLNTLRTYVGDASGLASAVRRLDLNDRPEARLPFVLPVPAPIIRDNRPRAVARPLPGRNNLHRRPQGGTAAARPTGVDKSKFVCRPPPPGMPPSPAQVHRQRELARKQKKMQARLERLCLGKPKSPREGAWDDVPALSSLEGAFEARLIAKGHWHEIR